MSLVTPSAMALLASVVRDGEIVNFLLAFEMAWLFSGVSLTSSRLSCFLLMCLCSLNPEPTTPDSPAKPELASSEHAQVVATLGDVSGYKLSAGWHVPLSVLAGGSGFKELPTLYQ